MKTADLFHKLTPAPCRGCTARTQGCHAGCERYKNWRVVRDQEKAAIQKKFDRDYQQDSFVIDSWSAARKRLYHKPRKKI